MKKLKVMQKLDSASAICLTTNGWTSVNNTSFMALTAHYLLTSPGLCIHSSLLSCSEFSVKHTAKNISNWLVNTMREWGIKNKITAIVTDNAHNMIAAVSLCKWRRISGFAHSLNLVVQRGLLEVDEVICKVKAVIQHFKQSAHATSKFHQMQTQMGLPQLKLKQDIITRWNSTYDMLQRFLLNKDSLLSTLALLGLGSEKFKFVNNDWLIIKYCLEMLQPFYEFTKDISAEKSVTISKIPVLSRIIARRLNATSDIPPEVAKMKRVLLEELSERFSGDLENHPIVGMAVCWILVSKSKDFQTKIGLRMLRMP